MAAKLTRSGSGALPLITSYGDGGFRVAGERYDGAVLIVNGLVTSIDVMAVADLLPEHLAPVMTSEAGVEILLIGCGKALLMPPAGLRRVLEDAKIACDPMDTGAAARTYNVLTLEDRRVAVLLLPV